MTVNKDRKAVSDEDEPHIRLAGEDKQLVDLVATLLVDPNIHTDARMRLHREIADVLRSHRETAEGPRTQQRRHSDY